MMRLVQAVVLILGMLTSYVTHALDNGLGRVPQMGWNSWYDLGCSTAMNESTVRNTADALVTKGLAAKGFRYVNLDDCYIKSRLPNGTLVPDPRTFASGMRSLANYIHNVSVCTDKTAHNMSICNYSESAGIRFGVYTDRGQKTCAGRPAAQGFEAIDAATYANWTVDYLKEDSCDATKNHSGAFAEYAKMRDGLNATNRSIFFSLCGWETWYAPQGAALANSWRIGPDDGNWHNIIKNIDLMAEVAQYAGPTKGWNDPCLLVSADWTGKHLITELQTRAQFSMWSVMAAPLLISGTILHMSNYTLETYTNDNVIKINQDILGAAGERIFGADLSTCTGGTAPCTNVWSKRLASLDSQPAAAMVFINVGGSAADVHCDAACWTKAGFAAESFPVYVTDLWNTSNAFLLKTPEWTAESLAANGGFAMLQVNRPPSSQALPHLDIPHCLNGAAVATNFKNDRTPPPSKPANQSTRVEVCWDTEGLRFHTNATDVNIFSTATKCNDPTFSDGDVLEVFVGPVAQLTDVPSWYLELDTGASGALWGMLAHNPLSRFHGINRGGDVDNMGCEHVSPASSCKSDATHGCSTDGPDLAACMFECTGKSDFVHGMSADVKVEPNQWWTNTLKVPWEIFPASLPRNGPGGSGWKNWRLNLYRYDYGSSQPGCSLDKPHTCKQEELSGWSSSGEGDFHLPQWFGSATLLDKE